MKQFVLVILVLVLASVSCRTGSKVRRVDLFLSATATFANTPTLVLPTQTSVIVVVSATPAPSVGKCVIAPEAVHLRPSPSNENYPIMALPNGAQVIDLGGRSDKWMFVQFGDKQGWIHGDFVGECQ
jgi:hypothetical protein